MPDANDYRRPDCISRRRWLLRAGSLAGAGLSLPAAVRAAARAEAPPATARSCIVFFMEGGPAHQDLWDMKPEAPLEVRGEFRPIATSLSGVHVCEHLPLFARQMHRVALVRSVHHRVVDHNAGAYYALTGRSPTNGKGLIERDEPDNFPPYGAVIARLSTANRSLPPFVHLPDMMSNNGHDLPGQRAGFLGARYDPLVAGDPSVGNYSVPGLALPPDVSLDRLFQRRTLLARLDGLAPSAPHQLPPEFDGMSAHYARAFDLLSATATRRAFDLSREPIRVRERYGLADRRDRSLEARKFGGLPHLGQCTLLARRLIEAGVRLVTIATGRRYDQAWDTHRQHFPLLKKSLLPYADRAMSALVEDLAGRGLLDETLVVFMGEFGRTPRLGQITSGAGADAAGRDHWPHCYSVIFAGGGTRGGAVYGASDRHAAYPRSDAVTPEDVAATIYHALGIPLDTEIRDQLDRPHLVATGKPIPIFG
ncbi:MAG: DUF1501 domain-containing protein [Pirellulales bacterium]